MDLLEAINVGEKDVAAFLVEDGAPVSDMDENGATPLHIAALKGGSCNDISSQVKTYHV